MNGSFFDDFLQSESFEDVLSVSLEDFLSVQTRFDGMSPRMAIVSSEEDVDLRRWRSRRPELCFDEDEEDQVRSEFDLSLLEGPARRALDELDLGRADLDDLFTGEMLSPKTPAFRKHSLRSLLVAPNNFDNDYRSTFRSPNGPPDNNDNNNNRQQQQQQQLKKKKKHTPRASVVGPSRKRQRPSHFTFDELQA